MPPEVTITACALSSNAPVTVRLLACPRAMPDGFQDLPGDRVDGARAAGQPGDAVAELELDEAPGDPGAYPPLEGRDHFRPGPPRDVEARHGVPVTVGVVAAALRPADHREEADPLLVQQDRFSPAAKSTYASAQRRGQWSSARSKPAVPIQSWRASA